MTVNDKLDEIDARANAATDGPWRADDEHGEIHGGVPAWVVSREGADGEFLGDVAYAASPTREQADATFIAAARQDVPALVNALRAVLALADEMAENGGAGLASAVRTAIEENLR